MNYKDIWLEEPKFEDVKSLINYDKLVLMNSLSIEIDTTILYNYFNNIEGRDRIILLEIDHTSQLEDVEIIKAFPNLKHLRVYGDKIKTLKGLEWFKKGRFLDLYMSENKKRNIDNISKSSIRILGLRYQRKDDFDAISKCLTLKDLKIGSSPKPDFYTWSNVPLECLTLTSGKFNELGDMDCIKTLKKLDIRYCKKLERFTGDNNFVKDILIVSCNKLDLSYLNVFKNVRKIQVNLCSQKLNLSELKLPKIRHLGLKCRVNIDNYDLKANMPKLIEITLNKISKKQVRILSEANLNIMVSNGYDYFLNGKLMTYDI